MKQEQSLNETMDENNKEGGVLPGLDSELINDTTDMSGVVIKKESLISNETQSDPSFGDLQTQEKEQPLEDEDIELYGPPIRKPKVEPHEDEEEILDLDNIKSSEMNGMETEPDDGVKQIPVENQETVDQCYAEEAQTGILKVFGWDPDNDAGIDRNKLSTYYHFEYCDKRAGTCPGNRMCYGEAPNISETLPHDPRDPYIEMTITSGHVRDGAICVFQKTVKPKILNTFDLHGCYDMWTVSSSKTRSTERNPDHHKQFDGRYSEDA